MRWATVQIDMRIIRDSLYPKYSYPDAKTRRAAWIERAARKKAELADKLDSNEMLIACLRFYPEHLTPQFMGADVLMTCHRKLTRKWQRHLKAARLILVVWSRKDDLNCLYLRLARNWERRVFDHVGLPLIHPAEAEEFTRLNANLELEGAIQSYSDAHPVLEEAKNYLRGWTHSLQATINNLPADTPPPVIEPVPLPPASEIEGYLGAQHSSYWQEQIKRRLTGK